MPQQKNEMQNPNEDELLPQFGYDPDKKITKCLQGEIITARTSKRIIIAFIRVTQRLLSFDFLHIISNDIADIIVLYASANDYVIKKIDIKLHHKRITIQNDKSYALDKSVFNAKEKLKHFKQIENCPAFIVKYIRFFETKNHYHLVMENGGSDLFDFIVSAHKLINEQKLKIKEWRKFVKYMLYQMVVAIKWLHNEMNCCHLDICLENMLIQNGNFIICDDGYYSIDPNLKIKICDFGLAMFFDPVQGFQCKQIKGGTVSYKSPQRYQTKSTNNNSFDARRSDIWSLGVVLFNMAVGSPPYLKPKNDDAAYSQYIKPGLFEQLLFQWNRHSYVTVKMLDLMKQMMKFNENERYLIDDVLQHNWLKAYHVQYHKTHN